jgi:hypothetical protein
VDQYAPVIDPDVRRGAPPLRHAFWRSQAAVTIKVTAAAPLFRRFKVRPGFEGDEADGHLPGSGLSTNGLSKST